MSRDDLGNVVVDFVWGNIPMQPNDDRETPLDPELDSHIMATEGYQGFPDFIQGYPYDDVIPNVTAPNVVGLTIAAAATVISNAGIESYSLTSSTDGANSGNDGKVKSQNPVNGTLVNSDSDIALVVYSYTAATHPIAGFNRTVTDQGWTLNTGDAIMYLIGRTVKPTVGDVILVTGSGNSSYNQGWNVIDVVNNDSYNTGGTAVLVTCFEQALSGNTSSGGNWALYF